MLELCNFDAEPWPATAIGGKTRTKIANIGSNPVQIGSKVIATRSFYVEPFFDSGWFVEKGMTGFCKYLIEEGPVVDFNQAFGNTDGQLGDICLLCPEDALDVVDERS
jgi:hypothetical protein